MWFVESHVLKVILLFNSGYSMKIMIDISNSMHNYTSASTSIIPFEFLHRKDPTATIQKSYRDKIERSSPKEKFHARIIGELAS